MRYKMRERDGYTDIVFEYVMVLEPSLQDGFDRAVSVKATGPDGRRIRSVVPSRGSILLAEDPNWRESWWKSEGGVRQRFDRLYEREEGRG
jgi:hypothetical protein